MYSVYNEIRVFVSAYVWMTGFGNFLYFDKQQDFSLERGLSMWLRINYFPLLLSFCLNVPLELYYVVPLHTAGFFITMATCKLAAIFREKQICHGNHFHCNLIAILTCLLIHVLFYETPMVDILKLFSTEYHFRFQADKYTAWVGILSGLLWFKVKAYMQWAYLTEESALTLHHKLAIWGQRMGGVGLILFWYSMFGYMADKYIYNPTHPYVFWIPVVGWLMIRNSSKYLCEVHCTALEFFGKITLETYVLQFHLFMTKNVQYIPIVLPGSGPDGHGIIKFLNMLLCGAVFVYMAYWARHHTVTTQSTITELAILILRGGPASSNIPSSSDNKNGTATSIIDVETQALHHKNEETTNNDREDDQLLDKLIHDSNESEDNA
jgi:N-acetylneuraminate 9-O-acetyltransferase